MGKFKERIRNWINELLSSGEPAEVVSFLEEVPVRVKSKVLNFDKERGFVEWEICPRLKLALQETKQLYIPFFDPVYNTKRTLVADVIYIGKNLAETTFPNLFDEPRFRRQHLRVRTSKKLPLQIEIPEKPSLEVRDISEGGVGLFLNKETLKLGDTVEFKITFPNGKSYNVAGEVVHLETGDQPIAGIKFINPSRLFINEVNKYIMKRQREIMDNIKLFAE